MNLDQDTLYSDAQDIGVAIGTVVSTNVYDAGAAGALGEASYPNLHLFVDLDEALDSAGSATIAINLQTATDEAFTSPVTYPLIAATAFDDFNDSYAETIARFQLPFGLLRYTRLTYVIAGADTTAGTVTAGIVVNTDRHHFYATSIGEV